MARRSVVQIEFQVVRQLISSFRDGVPTRQGQRVRGVSTIRAKGVAVARGLADRNTVRSSFTRAPSGVPLLLFHLVFFPLFCFFYKRLPPVLLFLLHFPFESQQRCSNDYAWSIDRSSQRWKPASSPNEPLKAFFEGAERWLGVWSILGVGLNESLMSCWKVNSSVHHRWTTDLIWNAIVY